MGITLFWIFVGIGVAGFLLIRRADPASRRNTGASLSRHRLPSPEQRVPAATPSGAPVGMEELAEPQDPGAPKSLIEALKDEGGYRVVKAGPPAVGLLVAALAHENPRVQREAECALEAMFPASVDAVIQALVDRSPEVRKRAAYILRLLDGKLWKHGQRPEWVEPLVGYLNHTDPNVRVSSAATLATWQNPYGVQSLLVLLGDQDPNIVTKAIGALPKTADSGVIGKVAACVVDIRNRGRQTRDDAVWEAVRAIEFSACQAFSYMCVREIVDRTAVEPLVDDFVVELDNVFFTKKDPLTPEHVRRRLRQEELAEMLLKIGHPKAVPSLKRLSDRDVFRGHSVDNYVRRFVEEFPDYAGSDELLQCALCGKLRPASQTRGYVEDGGYRYFCLDTCWRNRGRVVRTGIGQDCPHYREGMCGSGDNLCSLQVGHYASDCHVFKILRV